MQSCKFADVQYKKNFYGNSIYSFDSFTAIDIKSRCAFIKQSELIKNTHFCIIYVIQDNKQSSILTCIYSIKAPRLIHQAISGLRITPSNTQ